uniref:Uncharacterized protein n=1 Tax=uncultured marine virus TaxID=186617 RepID=A0A0F7LA28_9VIRU|nr:hypothetical protein [uncultured marine virus]
MFVSRSYPRCRLCRPAASPPLVAFKLSDSPTRAERRPFLDVKPRGGERIAVKARPESTGRASVDVAIA